MKIYLSPANHHKPYIISGYTEKNEMEKIAKVVLEKLSKYNCEVFYPTVFNSAQNYVGRPEEAKKLNADLYVSIHSNAAATMGSYATGCVGFYHPSNINSKKLATNIVNVLDGICPIKSNRYQSVVDGMAYIPGYGLGEIREPHKLGITSVLIETNFHSYEPTARYILDNTVKIAEGIVKGIVNTYNLKLKSEVTPKPNPTPSYDCNGYEYCDGYYNCSNPVNCVCDYCEPITPNQCEQECNTTPVVNNTTTNSKVIYRVQTGAYSLTSLNYAISAANVLASKGYTSIIIKAGNYYKLQVGAFSVKANAVNFQNELKLLGYTSFITTEQGTIIRSTASKVKVGDVVYLNKLPVVAIPVDNFNGKVTLTSSNGLKLTTPYTITKLYAGMALIKGVNSHYIKLEDLSTSKIVSKEEAEKVDNGSKTEEHNILPIEKFPYDTGKFKVTSIYGYRVFNGKYENHKGIDLVGIDSKTVTSVTPGTVVRSRIVTDSNDKTSEWGNYVAIQSSEDKSIHYYCHLASRFLKVGDKVVVGTPIGIEGATGKATGVHLHYQVTNAYGSIQDPSKYLGILNKIGNYSL